MVLIVFCHSSLAYNVPKKLIEEIRKHDHNYEDGNREERIAAIKFFEEFQKKYKPLSVGYLLTGDIG